MALFLVSLLLFLIRQILNVRFHIEQFSDSLLRIHRNAVHKLSSHMRPAQTPYDAFDLVVGLIGVCHQMPLETRQQTLRRLSAVVSGILEVYCLSCFTPSAAHHPYVRITAGRLAWLLVALTWSGVMGIDKAWYDVARTLGASQRFLILRVAIPAALPNVFVGLFMGLGASFSVLIVAEMVGVKSGIGFYLQWAQGWAAYPNMYAALLVMALLCSGLISGLFMLRDRLLSWQRGGMQW